MKDDPPLRPLPAQLEVVPHVDELVEAHGFAPCSPYTEVCWLPVLGPTPTLLFRRLGSWATQHPDGLTVDTLDLSKSFGLGEGLGRNSMLGRSIGRLVMFDAARWQNDALAVRRALGPVPERLAGRLSASSFRMHRQVMDRR